MEMNFWDGGLHLLNYKEFGQAGKELVRAPQIVGENNHPCEELNFEDIVWTRNNHSSK